MGEHTIVEIVDLNKSGSVDVRIAELDNRFFVFKFDLNAGQILSLDSNEFARHNDMGILSVGRPYKTLAGATRYAKRFIR